MDIYKLIFLCIAGFFAAFVDSIAGGGGIISVPAYMIVGLPTHIALGTNKFAATMGSLTSSINFIRSGNCNFKLLKIVAPFTLIGSILGVKTVLLIDESFLQPLVLILILAIGIYTFFSKSLGEEDNFNGFTKKNLFLSILLGFSLGFYDGFFGPGTGTFLVFGFINILGLNFLKASANARVLNFVSNISALVTFALSGNINYLIGIPVCILMILGAKIGTRLAINKGNKIIKPIFITMAMAVAVKMLFQII
ncbi:TSUP family transporter [Clostridium culturomicium]|uniref:TSUP family transporter n=1 Tax=Clostridium culturomicium TaxID=1499683 RepID=UPI00058E4E52